MQYIISKLMLDDGLNGVSYILLLSLFLPLLCYMNSPCRYYLKFFVYHLHVSIVSFLIIPYALARPRNVRNTLLAAKMIAPLRHAFGLRYHIVGAEHLTVDRAAVIVANHQSSLDILGMLVFWGLMDKVATVAKKILLLCGPFGLGAWLCGTVFIDRAQSGTAKSTVNKAIDEVKEKRVKMWIFPEGTRNNNGSMLPFKKGAFHLAVQNQLPIIPVVYSSYLNFLDSKAKKFGPGDITISALPPISVEGLKPSDVGELAERVRKLMLEEFQKNSPYINNLQNG